MRKPVHTLPELWILTVLSAVLRFWRLYSPQVVVFDELHYERFAGYYNLSLELERPRRLAVGDGTTKAFSVAVGTEADAMNPFFSALPQTDRDLIIAAVRNGGQWKY